MQFIRHFSDVYSSIRCEITVDLWNKKKKKKWREKLSSIC